MYSKIAKAGARTYGLLSYLYGPGRRDEHVAPHLVASWDGQAPDPGRDPGATLKQLQEQLDLPVEALEPHQRPKKHVWHCSVRTAPGDRVLSDEEWGQVARRIVAAAGIAPAGDMAACRWAAVRHADDHIHIVATLVREDGRRPDHHRSGMRTRAECARIEAEWGLHAVAPGDGTGAQPSTSAERFKADRTGRPRPVREQLREAVRQAVAGAMSEEEFFTRLKEAGLRFRERAAPSGDLLGYTVALPGDRNRAGEPIWFSGSKLAPDLSLPRIRERLATTRTASTNTPSPKGPSRRYGEGRQAGGAAWARRRATSAVEHAATVLGEGEDRSAAAQLTGAGEVLDALAKTAAIDNRAQLLAAARAFERATASHIRAQHADARALRSAARGIITAGGTLGRGEDGGTTAMVLSALVLLVIAASRWHSARGHAQQAVAARQAADHLRAAYQAAARAPMAAWRAQGRSLPPPVRDRHTRTVRAVLAERAGRLEDEAGFDALAAVLSEAKNAGHDPEALLTQAVELRELDSAESMSDVLVWRIRRIADLPTEPRADRRASTSRTRQHEPAPTPPRTASPAPVTVRGADRPPR